MKQKLISWFKKEPVFLIASIFAVLTMFFVKPSAAYLDYIDFRVLVLLFSLMAVVAGFQENGIFIYLSRHLLKVINTTRGMCLVLIFITFFSAMWITNDVALITFVPLAVLVLKMAEQTQYNIFVIVMQTIAANLGSMLTPVGNPQNLYLYSYYKMNIWEFFKITLPFVLISFLLFLLIQLFIKKDTLYLHEKGEKGLINYTESKEGNIKHSILYFILFLICIAAVLHTIDYRIAFSIVILMILYFDKKIIKKVDYFLLLTFVSFFLFAGNLSNMDEVRIIIEKTIKSREFISSLILSQVISNVPAAILLSNFTSDAKSLVLGTDIGGLGTIIASLASLISFKIYCRTCEARSFLYLLVFTAANVGFLVLFISINFIIN